MSARTWDESQVLAALPAAARKAAEAAMDLRKVGVADASVAAVIAKMQAVEAPRPTPRTARPAVASAKPVAARPPHDPNGWLTMAQIEENKAHAAKHAPKKTEKREKLEKEAREVGLGDEEIKRLGDRDLEEAVRRHKISDGHGKDAVPYPKPLPPRKKEDDEDKAIAAQLREMAGNVAEVARR